MTAARGYSGIPAAGPKPIRSWSSVLAVQLQARVEVLRALVAALCDLSTAVQPFEDLEDSLAGAMFTVLEYLQSVEAHIDQHLDALVVKRAHPAGGGAS